MIEDKIEHNYGHILGILLYLYLWLNQWKAREIFTLLWYQSFPPKTSLSSLYRRPPQPTASTVSPSSSQQQWLTPSFTLHLLSQTLKNFIPITLEMEKSQYYSWSELFKIHRRAYQVLDHIIPPSSDASTSKDKTAQDTELWSRLDAIVLQWIYGTISTDLLHTILAPDLTAKTLGTTCRTYFRITNTPVQFILRINSRTLVLIIFLTSLIVKN